ncbi:hypothetical protein ANN_22673 [Periplaneta americana]|uniref:Regulatory protein zeste n=1 Tax=Periplaneta americana TaxID=6978 RepID=A0ABQ8S938_PERAM|nr:hypothetical protein ANN_22673 [Periplaneta americana]
MFSWCLVRYRFSYGFSWEGDVWSILHLDSLPINNGGANGNVSLTRAPNGKQLIHNTTGIMAKRVSNFSKEEKTVLSDIIRNYDVVENKSYNSETLEKKKAAWRKITDVFNSSFPQNPPRDTNTLMGLWRRLKLQAKCSLDKKRNTNKGTGGGPPGSPITTIEETVIAVLDDSAEPLENPYDDEGGYAEEIPVREMYTINNPIFLVSYNSKKKYIWHDVRFVCSLVKSNKRRSQEVDEADEMMREIHAKQLQVLELQERKALSEIYLVEKEILKKGYELSEWHTQN